MADLTLRFEHLNGDVVIRTLPWNLIKNDTLMQLRQSAKFQAFVNSIFGEAAFFKFYGTLDTMMIWEYIPLRQLNIGSALKIKEALAPLSDDRTILLRWGEGGARLNWAHCHSWTVKYLHSLLPDSWRAADVRLFQFDNPYEPLYPEAILRDCVQPGATIIPAHTGQILPSAPLPWARDSVAPQPRPQTITDVELVALITEDKVDQCSICLENLLHSDREAENKVKQIKECKHLFHPQCLTKWLSEHATCPLCRVLIRSR